MKSLFRVQEVLPAQKNSPGGSLMGTVLFGHLARGMEARVDGEVITIDAMSKTGKSKKLLEKAGIGSRLIIATKTAMVKKNLEGRVLEFEDFSSKKVTTDRLLVPDIA